MKKRSRYTQSGLSRSIPGKHFLRNLLHGRIGRHHTRVEDVEDETPGSKVVRLLVVVLFVHIVVIGGVALHGYLKADSPKTATASLMGSVPAPVVAAPARVNTEVHITDAATIGDQSARTQSAAVVPGQSVNPAASRAGASGAASAPVRAGSVSHMVVSGETWPSIAAQHGCSVEDLRMVNPDRAVLASGMSLSIPAKPGEASVAAVAEEVDEDKGAVYIMKPGDTLAKIARKHKTTTAQLLSLNKMTEKDARRLRPGKEIKLPQ